VVSRREVSGRVPQGVVTASEWAWRALLIAAALLGLWWLLRYFSAVAVPVAVAVLLTALLTPILRFPLRWGWPPMLAAAGSMVAVALLLGGVFSAIGVQVVREWPALFEQSAAGLRTLIEWLGTGPLGISQAEIDGYLASLTQWVNESAAVIAGAAASAGAGLAHFFAGAAIALISTFFFLSGGQGIWRSALTLVPVRYRAATDRAFTFITAFIPVVGAVLSGTIAVALALVTHGWVSALIMLGITVLVVQTEGHFLQPLLLGRAVSLHPLAVLLGLAVGATLAGIVGALLVIPVLSFGVAFIRGLDPKRYAAPTPGELHE
jgi:predicted PurR-regulated permease PerM